MTQRLIDRAGMRHDLLEMAERAAGYFQWDTESMLFEIDCVAFAAELGSREEGE